MHTLQTSEHDLQHGQITAYLVSPPATGGLGWQAGKADQMDPDTLLIRSDVLDFLQHGNAFNQAAWGILRQAYRNDEVVIWAAVRAALMEAQHQATSQIEVIRSGIKVDGLHFSLWNAPVGRATLHSDRHAFSRNCFRVTNEATIRLPGTTLKRRPDQVFHVNGLFFSLQELKAKQKGQSAGGQGRDKVVGDYRHFAAEVLRQAQARWEKDQPGQIWKGLGSLSNFEQKAIRSQMAAFEKAAWVSVVDGGSVWIAGAMDTWLAKCDASFLVGQNPAANDLLREEMLKGFTRLPPIADLSASDMVQTHLAGLLDPIHGVAQEIALFHHWRADRSTQNRDFLRPRNPQRVIMERFNHRVDELYAQESDPDWLEKDLRAKLQHALPHIEPAEADRIVSERLRYRNGRDAYSILFQGAAGLGKTNLAVWMGVSLYNRLAPLKAGEGPDTPRQPMFDRVVILTDRTELRDNIADEADRTSGSRHQLLKADTKEILKSALTGAPLPAHVKSGAGIIVVNLQKFPRLIQELASEGHTLNQTQGRTAFIIDEVHRTQSGKLHEQTTALFMSHLTTLAQSSRLDRKNLIIGLTATPSDIVLARFGEWHSSVAASDKVTWKPYFSYALNQAIEDGYILNSYKNPYTFSVDVDWNSSLAAQKAQGRGRHKLLTSADLLYENPERQRLVAEKFSKLFAEITMQAIPIAKGLNTARVGRAKAMVTVPSIKAALGMRDAIRTALLHLADNAKDTPWERYADVVREVAQKRLFVLYSDSPKKQGQARPMECAKANGGLSEKDVIKAFRCADAGRDNLARNAIIVVVDKLLTGFDEPTLHTLLIDRALSGIALFQASCRNNRSCQGKDSTMLIDTSDNNLELKKVFAKYGHLAVSELDGLDLQTSLDMYRKKILEFAEAKQLWDRWKITDPANSAARASLSKAINNTMEALPKQDPGAAKTLRSLIGGYLTRHHAAHILLTLERPHTNDKNWLGWLQEVHYILGNPKTKKTPRWRSLLRSGGLSLTLGARHRLNAPAQSPKNLRFSL